MKILRTIAIVLVPFYWVITWAYHKLYDWRVLKSKSYNLPVICVGNLAVGGTGKTPMIEYLIKLLITNYKVATLSRGYNRKTTGFLVAGDTATSLSIGDEPYQLFKKFDNITVAVDENRQRGICNLLQQEPTPDIILLDDAFQHRQVTAGLNILLTAFDDLYCDDFLLPTGNLREPASGADRAQLVVVTKCPADFNNQQKTEIKNKLHLKSNQDLFFSCIIYDEVVRNETTFLNLNELSAIKFTLVTGIANPSSLVIFLKERGFNFEHLQYNDHHYFTETEIEALEQHSLILTTEKDFTRLSSGLKHHKNLYYIPITISIEPKSQFETTLRRLIQSYLSTDACEEV